LHAHSNTAWTYHNFNHKIFNFILLITVRIRMHAHARSHACTNNYIVILSTQIYNLHVTRSLVYWLEKMSAGIMNVPTWLLFSKKVKMYVTSFATMFIYTKAEIVPLDN
jgi:hypothetical protein